tara:strand:- start:525 stop:674 length:150 start_codon:yes stop_codon:yes gene_type:complete
LSEIPKTHSLVRLEKTVKAELDELGKKKDTYSQIIKRLIDSFKEVNRIE